MKLCYIIGYPVDHSLSPAMHNAAFHHLGLDYEYQPKAVKPGCLEEFIEAKVRNDPVVRGANVTIPHKVEAVKLMDRLDKSAKTIGAVNTIVNDDGTLTGYNTDGLGAVKALEEAYGSLRHSKVLLLGAGGAARAVAHQIAELVSDLSIINRSQAKAAALTESVRQVCKGASVKPGGLGDLASAISSADILINATSVGMKNSTKTTIVDPKLLRPGLLVFDLVYNPLRTKLLIDAEAAGAKVLYGAEMLVYQGAEAFRLWTSIEPPITLMMSTVMQQLGESER
jgi:shikimate dehydrogenase